MSSQKLFASQSQVPPSPFSPSHFSSAHCSSAAKYLTRLLQFSCLASLYPTFAPHAIPHIVLSHYTPTHISATKADILLKADITSHPCLLKFDQASTFSTPLVL
jgi:hypothetical protein